MENRKIPKEFQFFTLGTRSNSQSLLPIPAQGRLNLALCPSLKKSMTDVLEMKTVFPSKKPWRSTCESPAAGWVSTHKCPDHHQSTVHDHSTEEVCRSIISWLSSLDFSFTSSRLSKKRNSLKINVLVSPSSHPRLVCSLELESKQSYFIIYCHLKFLIVVKVRCTALKGTSFHYPTVKLIAGTLRRVRFTCKHMDTLVFLRCILCHSKGWACQMNYWGSNCKLTQITHSYQKETFYFFSPQSF